MNLLKKKKGRHELHKVKGIISKIIDKDLNYTIMEGVNNYDRSLNYICITFKSKDVYTHKKKRKKNE